MPALYWYVFSCSVYIYSSLTLFLVRMVFFLVSSVFHVPKRGRALFSVLTLPFVCHFLFFTLASYGGILRGA